MTNATERRCSAVTPRGQCRVTRGLNADGLCSMHSGATDPRELGRLSGKRRREPNPERVPASLRVELQKLDPAIVRGAIERALAGANESARVAAVKLLADVDAFRRDNLCSRCGMTPEDYEAEVAGSRQKLIELLSRGHQARVAAFAERGPEARALEDDGFVPHAQVEELAEELAQARLAALRAEHGVPA